MPEGKKQRQVGVKSTPPFKLKNQQGKDAVRINLLDVFGFVPEDIIVHRAKSSGTRIIVSAVLTPEEEKKRDRLIKEKMKKIKENKEKTDPQGVLDKEAETP